MFPFSMKSIKKIISVATAGIMMTAFVSFVPQNIDAFSADVCVVNPTVQYQTIKGFGGINHPEWTGQDLTEQQRQTAFGNGADELGLTVLRVFVNPDKNQWYKALPTAQYATKMGVTVFASPWEPPANLAESGGSNGKLHLPKSNYSAYAQHLNDFGTYMKNNNVDLYAISVQNEPDFASEWTYWSTDETTDFIANYGDKITSTRLMSPESFQYAPLNASWVPDGGKKFYKKILNNSKAMANCDLFGTHFYGTQRAWMDFPELENCGKEIWMTEVYVPNSDADSANRYPEALDVSENIHNAMVVGNMSAYTWWYIRRSYGLMTEDGKISKRGYCMAQYSKFVRPGDVRIDATEQPADNVYVSAYKNNKNQVTIVAVNKGNEGYAQNFAVDGLNISDVDRYRTSANENLAVTENLEYNGNSFFAQLPAQSVSTFVVTLDGQTPATEPTTQPSTKPAEPDSNGYYIHDTFEEGADNWSGHGSSSILLSGRTPCKGTNALLVQERASAWNGAEKTLDSSVFAPSKKFSFSADVIYLEGDETKNFAMTLQYTDSNGDTKYSRIASVTATKRYYAQLINTAYQIPEGASDIKVYIETESGTDNFYIDEFIVAVEGTLTEAPPVVTTTTTTVPVTTVPADNIIYGDANCDENVDIADVVTIASYVGDSNNNPVSEKGIKNADVHNTGNGINANDALIIQQYLAGIVTNLPA